jgi:hypothetical protein
MTVTVTTQSVGDELLSYSCPVCFFFQAITHNQKVDGRCCFDYEMTMTTAAEMVTTLLSLLRSDYWRTGEAGN